MFSTLLLCDPCFNQSLVETNGRSISISTVRYINRLSQAIARCHLAPRGLGIPIANPCACVSIEHPLYGPSENVGNETRPTVPVIEEEKTLVSLGTFQVGLADHCRGEKKAHEYWLTTSCAKGLAGFTYSGTQLGLLPKAS